jgi:uncharacterized protein involved in exopolysaccharide biosynthesis
MEHVIQSTDNEEISIKELITIVKKHGRFVVFFTLGMGLAAGIAAFIVPKWYEASTVLSPVSSTSGGLAGSATSQLEGSRPLRV